MTTAMKVTLTPERIALRPGESAEIEVSVQNASQVVEHFSASVIGLPREDLYSCEPAVVMLRPREVGTIRVRITVPDHAGLMAGLYTLGLLVRSPYQQDISRCEELPLDVQPAPALTLTAQPEVVTGGATGAYALTLTNEGNTPLAVTLAGGDPENQVGFEFSPRELLMEPGTIAGATLTVRANAPMTGQELRRTLTLRAHAHELTVEKQVAFLQRPRIAGGLLRVGGMAAGLAVLAGSAVGGALLIRDAKQENAAQTGQLTPPAITQPGANPTEAPNQAGNTGGPTQPATSAPGESTTPGAPSGASTTSGQLPPGSKIADFTRMPDGQPPGDRIITGDLYIKDGVTLSTVTEHAPPDCRDATAPALRTYGDFGSFLTSAKPAGADLCNTVTVRIDFAAPARMVRLNIMGAGPSYTMTALLSDGSTETRQAATQRSTITPITYEAPIEKTITAITLGHTNPDPTAKDPTIIKSIAFTPA